MKIIITVYTYYPLKDGVQFVTEYHAEGLVKLGHDVTVVTPLHTESPREEIHNGVKIIRMDIKTVHTIHHGDVTEYRNLILQLTEDADVIINVCTQCATTDLIYPLLSRIKCRKVLYMHGMHNFSWKYMIDDRNLSYYMHKLWNDIRWGWMYTRSGKYFHEYDEVLQLHRFDTANIFFKNKYGINCKILENAAESTFFERRSIGTSKSQRPYLVCVANYIPSKNQEMLIKAYYKAQLAFNSELILIGSKKTTYFNKLSLLCEQLSKQDVLKKVRLLYDISREETAVYVQNAAIFLFGSMREVFPISIIESMAAGIPFISTDVGCVRFFPGGVLVRNEDEMTYWIEMLMSEENIRTLMGNIGRAYAQGHMRVDTKVKELENILKG